MFTFFYASLEGVGTYADSISEEVGTLLGLAQKRLTPFSANPRGHPIKKRMAVHTFFDASQEEDGTFTESNSEAVGTLLWLTQKGLTAFLVLIQKGPKEVDTFFDASQEGDDTYA
ncbi:hypothetical protein QE152_g11284 [Popillia japonica]|uniref:Uncharacterized protein n=1 Tax=Popillia japonica TaxID=7064 RepID=A0AAW1LR46_POPJA